MAHRRDTFRLKHLFLAVTKLGNLRFSADEAGITSSSAFLFSKENIHFAPQVIAALPNIGFCSVALLAKLPAIEIANTHIASFSR